jgi:hypothetical protein
MNEKQKAIYEEIERVWKEKNRGLYVDRRNSKVISSLIQKGFVKKYPYTIQYGWVAYPSYAE